MRVRVHHEGGNRGVAVLETPPQSRTLFVYRHRGRAYLPFPNMLHVVRYRVHHNEYWYGGLYDMGHHVFFTDGRLESFDDVVSHPPTDPGGLVCSDHTYDNTAHPSLRHLVQTVVSAWWSVTHQLPSLVLTRWADREYEFQKIGSLRHVLDGIVPEFRSLRLIDESLS